MIGTEGVGKSHALNILATHPRKVPVPFQPEKNDYGVEGIGHTTQGINAYITSERVILLGEYYTFSVQLML